MNNALQMFTMPDLFKTDSLTSKQRSAEIPATKSFDSIFQNKTYGNANAYQDNFSNRKLADLSLANKKDQDALSAAKNSSNDRRNLIKPEVQEHKEIKDAKPVKQEPIGSDKAKAVTETSAQEAESSSMDNRVKKKLDAMKKLLKQTNEDIDQAVQNGTMSPEQAEILKTALSAMQEQITALESGMAVGTGNLPDGKLDEVLDKLQSGISKIKNLEIMILKDGKPKEVSSNGEVSQKSGDNKSSFDQILKEITSVVDEIKQLTLEVQKSTANVQAPVDKLIEQATAPEGQATAKATEEVAKKVVSADDQNSESVDLNKVDGKAVKATSSTTTQPATTPSADAVPSPKTDLQVANQAAVQQAENGVQGKANLAAGTTSGEDTKALKNQKVDAEGGIKQVDVAKFENTLVQTAKTEAPQAMKRFESNIMEQIQNMMQNSVKIVKAGNNEMVIRLKPENLGQVSLKLNMDGGNLSAEFKVENLMVKAMIESNMTDLKNALTEKGYNVSGFDVSLGHDGGKGAGHQAGQEQQRHFQNSGRDSDNGSIEKLTGFDSEMQRQQLDDRSSVINSLG